jgi:hypothetical protein
MSMGKRLLVILAAIGAVAGGVVTAGAAKAVVLLDEANLVSGSTVPAPSQYSFTASSAQALSLTLTDLKIPAAFSSLRVAVTLGDALIGSASVDAQGVATLAIPAAAGSYTVYVIGSPGATQGVGSFGVCVAPATSPTSCIGAYSFSNSIVAPSTVSTTGSSTLNTTFTSTVSGTYAVTVTDDAFPAALQDIAGGIAQGSTPVTSLSAGTTNVMLAGGTSYQIILDAIADSAVQAGLYGVLITDPNGSTVFARTIPVGLMPGPTVVDNPGAQALTLSLTDYAYPAALPSVGVAVTEGGAPPLAMLTASGSVGDFLAPSGSIEIWRYAVAGAQPGVYGVTLAPYPSTATTVPLFSATEVVDAAGPSPASYAFIVNLPAAGTYNLAVSDFKFPFPFPSLGTPTVAQNGSVLSQSASGDFTAAAGPAVVLVSPTAPQGGDGIFDVQVATSGATPEVLLDQTQAVGSAFSTTTINLGTSGTFATTLTDLGFPSSFQYLAVVVSQGGQVLGKIYTGGTFDFTATPGQYVLTFITTPDTTNATASLNNYGLYSVLVASAVPTLTFTAASASVTDGQTVQLTWSSQSATTCTASGGSGWTGSEPASGSTAVVIDSTTTLTLSCTGAGGTVTKSVTVAGTTAPSSGGGGALSGSWLAWLAAVWLVGLMGRQRGVSPAWRR